MLFIDNPQKSIPNILELIIELIIEVMGYELNIQNQFYYSILVTNTETTSFNF